VAIECVEQQEWIEEEISKPIEEWVEQTEQKCKKRPWWHPLRWLCWLVTTLVKVTRWVIVYVGKWVVRTVCKLVGTIIGTVWDVLTGLWDVIVGIFTLDWRRILHGLFKIVLAALNLALTIFRIVTLIDTAAYILEEINRNRLRNYVRKLLEAKPYSGEELQNIKDTLHLDRGAFGYRIPMIAIRTYLDSEVESPEERGVPNLVKLHELEKINLRELCGFEFTEGWKGLSNRKRYKTLKKGPHPGGGGGGEVDNPISKDELDTYLSSRGLEGPKFIVLCMRDGVLKTKRRTAELKARELGLMPRWTTMDREVKLEQHIVHSGSPISLVNFLTAKDVTGLPIFGRNRKPDAFEELCTPMAVGIFRYNNPLRGLSACLMGSSAPKPGIYKNKCTPDTNQSEHDASGVTFIDNIPDIIWKYVLIHELGHYFGLCHVKGGQNIMWSPKTYDDKWHRWAFTRWGWAWFILRGEPSFDINEAMQTWEYIVEHFHAHCLGGNDHGPIII
jgi:hypothetical protein